MDIDNIYQRHSAMFHGDVVNPRINHPQETWQNPRNKHFYGGFRWSPAAKEVPDPAQAQQATSLRFWTCHFTTEDGGLFKSFQPPNFCWLNQVKSPQLWVKSSEIIIEIWLSSAVAAALPGRPNACGCCPLGENNSEGRDSIPMRDLMRLEMTWKGSKNIYKKIKTYENVVFQVRILVTCYILSDSLIHWTLSNSKQVYIKHEVTGVWSHWSACAGSSSWGDPA